MKKTIKKAMCFVITLAVAAVTVLGSFAPVSAASEVPATKISFPSSVNLKVGESKDLAVNLSPGNTTYLTNIAWGYQENGHITTKVNGMGSYWGKPSSMTIKGTSAGTAYLFIDVDVYTSSKKFIKKYKFNTTVTVSGSTSSGSGSKPQSQSSSGVSSGSNSNKPAATATKKPSTSTKAKTAAPKTAAPADGFVSVGSAYKDLNKFRTKKGVWAWKKGNKGKTYYNTKKSNKLKALKKDASLEKTARLRAKEAAVKFSHTRPNGKDCFTAFPKKFNYRGENLVMNVDSGEVITELMETEERYSGQGHRRNMLNKNFTAVGIAGYRKNGVTYWAMCLGKK